MGHGDVSYECCYGVAIKGVSFVNGNLFFKFFSPDTIATWLVEGMVGIEEDISFFRILEYEDTFIDFQDKWGYGCSDECSDQIYQGNLLLDYEDQSSGPGKVSDVDRYIGLRDGFKVK